jgi:hypothetical protein
VAPAPQELERVGLGGADHPAEAGGTAKP